MEPTLRSVAVERLTPDPTQPRKQFIKAELERLAASIAARGVLQPLRVIHDDDQELWRIVTGESRWRAAKLAGLLEVPCLLVASASEADILADQLAENAVRCQLNPIDFAKGLRKLKALRSCNGQQLAAEAGISGASISRAEALLTLPESIQAMVESQHISESSAYELSRLDDANAQTELANLIAGGGMTRDEAAEAVRQRLGRSKERATSSRVGCRLDGVAVSLTAKEPLTWDRLIATLDASRKLARKLADAGSDISQFGKAQAELAAR